MTFGAIRCVTCESISVIAKHTVSSTFQVIRAMHEMMAEKGFVRRTEEEIREVGEAAERRKKEERDDKIRRAKEKNELREKARAERKVEPRKP